MNIILTDVDGVLLNWDEAFSQFMVLNGYTRKPDTDDQYQLSKRYYNLSDTTANQYVSELNTSKAMAHLNPIDGAVTGVQYLNSLGYKFICITAVSNDNRAREYRIENLDKVFGNDIFIHDQMICLSPGSSKSHALKKWSGSGYYWIEDHFRNAEAGFEVGLKPILINYPYNQQYTTDLFPRVYTWNEITDIIINKK